MARKQHFECVDCDAVFKISHDMDEKYYIVEHCPFCGSTMDDDQKDDYEDDEELS